MPALPTRSPWLSRATGSSEAMACSPATAGVLSASARSLQMRRWHEARHPLETRENAAIRLPVWSGAMAADYFTLRLRTNKVFYAATVWSPHIRVGSGAPELVEARRPRMSASPPIATKLLRRGSPPLRAITSCEQSQQTNSLFDHLVGAGEQRWRHSKAERPGGHQVDSQIELGWLLDR